uniref:Putative ovule protein n=1 Tax=Solanum chacoense TaxID=4108 RepID=A0A0V0GKU2_SOLCH
MFLELKFPVAICSSRNENLFRWPVANSQSCCTYPVRTRDLYQCTQQTRSTTVTMNVQLTPTLTETTHR